MAELLLARQRCWEPGQGEAADSCCRTETCTSINVLLQILSSASWLSFPLLAAEAFCPSRLESCLSPKRAGEWFEQGMDVKVLVSCP